jgi:uncharacterized FlgJ-related protein
MRTEISSRTEACGGFGNPKPLTFQEAACQAQQDWVPQGSTQQEKVSNNFLSELTKLINRYSKENASNTPDYILAEYLCSCLDVFSTTVRTREQWYGRRTF